MDDAAPVEDMHHVGDDVIEQPLVVRDDHRGVLRRMEFRDARGDDAQGVDVETRIGFVQNRQLRREHRHLEYLVLLLLAAREALVHGARRQFRGQLHDGALLAHQAQELGGRKRFLAAETALLIDGQLHEAGHRDARNLHRILETQEKPQTRPVLYGHIQQVAPHEGRRTFGDGELLVTREHRRERRFARAVRPHDGVHLAGLHLQVDAPENLLAIDRGVQIFYA